MSTTAPGNRGDLVATMRCPSPPGHQQLAQLITMDGDRPVVLDHHKQVRTLAPGEPFLIMSTADAADFDLQGWQRQTRAALEAAAAEAQRAELRSSLLEDLRTGLVVPEAIDSATRRENEMRREILETLGGGGICRRVGRKRGCWVLATKSGGFVPERPGAKVLVVGAAGLVDGEHYLMGMLDGHPAALTWPFAQPPRVRIVRDGRWRRPGAEDPARWLEMTRAELDREAEPDPEDVRTAMLDRLTRDLAITPASDGERVVLEVLVAEGYAARLDSAYVLAVEVDRDVS